MADSTQQPPLTPHQFETLLSIAEAFIPGLTAAELELAETTISSTVVDPKREAIDLFLKQSCVDDVDFVRYLMWAVGRIPEKNRKELGGILDLIYKGGLVSLLITRTTTSFPKLPLAQRIKLLQTWRDSHFQILRGLFSSLKRLTFLSYFKVNKTVFNAMEYPDHAALQGAGAGAGGEPQKEFHEFNFHSFLDNTATTVATTTTDADKDLKLEADIIIIGSGSGGGVVAAKLAAAFKAGTANAKKIMILEKGGYVPHEEMPVKQEDSGRLYDGGLGAFVTADDKGILLAGSCWGGGTTVNYSGALELPQEVREEWSKDHGLAFATTPEFQASFDRVSTRIGVTTPTNTHHTPANQLLLTTSSLLKLPSQPIPQNTAGNTHSCGLCAFGCRSGEKQGGAQTWLLDAERDGAVCVQKCSVEKILFDDGGKRVCGVRGVLEGGRGVRISARTVVMAAGAVMTPCLLIRSGVKDPKIGKNLKVHPMSFNVGYFDKKETKPWTGPIMTALVTAHTSPSHPTYGSKLFNQNPWPSTNALFLPWRSPLDFKTQVLRTKQSVWTVCVTRDRDSVGSVSPDPVDGRPVISYSLSKFDAENRTEAVITACKLQLVAGCSEVLPLLESGDVPFPPYHPPKSSSSSPSPQDLLGDPAFSAYLLKLRHVASTNKSWTSAHPQGTCRMGSDPETSVVDSTGKVWGYEGLYVADASLFPTAAGVNPMVTVMAVADWVAGGLVQRLA